MSKNFLRNDEQVFEDYRETLDYLNNRKDVKIGFLKREIRKLKKFSGGVL